LGLYNWNKGKFSKWECQQGELSNERLGVGKKGVGNLGGGGFVGRTVRLQVPPLNKKPQDMMRK